MQVYRRTLLSKKNGKPTLRTAWKTERFEPDHFHGKESDEFHYFKRDTLNLSKIMKTTFY